MGNGNKGLTFTYLPASDAAPLKAVENAKELTLKISINH